MQKTEIYNEIMKLDHKERTELVGAVAATFTAEEMNIIVKKKFPKWASSSLGKTVLGLATAALGVVAGYFLHQQGIELPVMDDQPVIEAPAVIE